MSTFAALPLASGVRGAGVFAARTTGTARSTHSAAFAARSSSFLSTGFRGPDSTMVSRLVGGARGDARVPLVVAAKGRGFMREIKNIQKGDPDTPKQGIQYDRPLRIRLYPDPCLRAENKDITTFDTSLKMLAKDMFDIMYRTDGVGLAAPQVGVNLRLMVYNPEGNPRRGEEFILCNPKIVGASEETEPFEEGCLSFPEIYADVIRPSAVAIEYQDVNGKKQSIELNEFQARVFQHEYDHLQGALYHDRMSPEVLGKVEGELAKLRDAWKEEHGTEGAP